MLLSDFAVLFITIHGSYQAVAQLTIDPLNKPYRLRVLTTFPLTGGSVASPQTCMDATNFVADVVNSRTDILPHYKVDIFYGDEFTDSALASRLLVEYVTWFQEKNTDPTLIQSPTVLGASASAGCGPFAQLLKPLNMVATTSGCGAPYFTADRQKYPNFYRLQTPADVIAYSTIRFIKQVGGWNDVGVIHSRSVTDIGLAKVFYEGSLALGVRISYYDSADTMTTEIVKPYKDNDVRIVATFFPRASSLIDFLCFAYQFGMTGPKYFFIARAYSFINPATVPNIVRPGCTRAIVKEQLKITAFLAGTNANPRPARNDGKTNLGYDLAEYEVAFDKYTNKSRPDDYAKRFECHDAALQMVITLNDTETRLQKMNLSLKDYRNNPELVMKVANQSAASVQLFTLRYGREFYSSRVEVDSEPSYIFSWNLAGNFEYNYKVFVKPDSILQRPDTYEFQLIKPLEWSTSNGKPPKDAARVVYVKNNENPKILYGALAVSIPLSLAQLCTLLRLLFCRKSVDFDKSRITRALFVVGCMVLNVAALCFAGNSLSPSTENRILLCRVKFALTVVGFTVMHGYLISRLYLLNRDMERGIQTIKKNTLFTTMKTNLFRSRKNNSSVKSAPRRLPQPESAKEINHQNLDVTNSSRGRTSSKTRAPISTPGQGHERKISSFTGGFLGFNIALLVAWLAVERQQFVVEETDRAYDGQVDLWTITMEGGCVSANNTAWEAAIAALHGCVLLFGAFLAYSLRLLTATNLAVNKELAKLSDISKESRLAVLNCCTILAASILILIGLQNQTAKNDFLIAILLFESLSGSIIISISVIKDIFVKQELPAVDSNQEL